MKKILFYACIALIFISSVATVRAEEEITQIEVEVEFVEFDKAEVNKLANGEGITLESLHKIRKQEGTANLLANPRLITLSGTKAEVKGVIECIYPTELKIGNHPSAQDSNNLTINDFAPPIVPASFQTREVGVLLSVLPVIQRNKMIAITITPALVGEPSWKEYSSEWKDGKGKSQSAEISQPFFPVQMVTTSINARSGKKIMLGGGTTKAGKDKQTIVYIFMTAWILNSEGDRIK